MSEHSAEITDRGGAISIPCHVFEVAGLDVDGHPLYRLTVAEPCPVYILEELTGPFTSTIIGGFSKRADAEACRARGDSRNRYVIREVEVDAILHRKAD